MLWLYLVMLSLDLAVGGEGGRRVGVRVDLVGG